MPAAAPSPAPGASERVAAARPAAPTDAVIHSAVTVIEPARPESVPPASETPRSASPAMDSATPARGRARPRRSFAPPRERQVGLGGERGDRDARQVTHVLVHDEPPLPAGEELAVEMQQVIQLEAPFEREQPCATRDSDPIVPC